MIPNRSPLLLALLAGLGPVVRAEPPASDKVLPTLEHAQSLAQSGQFEEAEKEYETIVQGDLATLGEQNPKTLSDRVLLAVAKSKTGQTLAAEAELRALLAIYVRRRGPDHDETVSCRTALARLLDDLGRSQEAIEEFKDILDARERMLGPDSVEVARVERMLGDALVSARQFKEAIPHFQKAQPILVREFGPEGREPLLNRSNLAWALGENAQFDDSERELKEILAIRERLFGVDDVSVFTTCLYLARVLAGHGTLEEAYAYATRSRSGLKAKLPPGQPVIDQAIRLCDEIKADIALHARKDAAATPPSP